MHVFLIVWAFLLQPCGVSGAAVGYVIYGETRQRGLAPWKFDEPMGMDLSPNDELLIADNYNHRIQACRGHCRTVAGGNGLGDAPRQLKSPYSVVSMADGRIIIADTLNDRIQRWDVDATSGVSIINESQGLVQPAAIVLDEDNGYLFVADTGNHAVLRYRFDSARGEVIGNATVMAGLRGNYSANLTHLDNPMALFYERSNRTLFIADARNKRIIRWNEFEDEGVVEVDNLPGRPYGIFMSDGVLYYADADDCVVWKRLENNMTASVAGTPGSCGGEFNQLRFPTGFLVSSDGTLTISDTINHRVVRWDPNPKPARQSCLLSRHCKIDTTDGNPTSGNLLVIVSEDSQCGGTCYASGLWGPLWNNRTRPNQPLLRDVSFDLGVAMLGHMGNYRMCWGSRATDTSIFDTPDDNGNFDCSSVPVELGLLYMDFFINEDLNGSRTQCVKGAMCWVVIVGYAIPFDVKVISPPSTDWTGKCGESNQENFLGYRESVNLNPGSYPLYGGYEMPFNGTNWTNCTTCAENETRVRNMTTMITQTFGVATGRGRVPMCLCPLGDDCTAPYMFPYAAGYMRIRSTLGNERWYCLMDDICVIQVHGAFLKSTDVVMIVSHADDCGIRPSINGSLMFSNANAGVGNLVPYSEMGEDYFEVTLDLGNASVDRMFQICYCASYDTDDERVDAGDTECDSLTEFSMSAGTLGVVRVHTADFECPITKNCSIDIWGVKMLPKKVHPMYASDNRLHDKLLMEFGSTDAVCGKVIPLEGVMYANGNVYDPTEGGNSSYLLFDFGVFTVAGVRALCFCSTFDAKSFKKGTCNDEDEFYQPIGRMVVRGPVNEPIRCIAEIGCFPHVRGTELSGDDRFQICPHHSWCGSSTVCPAAGPQAVQGLVEPWWTSDSTARYSVGTLPLGLYAICYCAAGRNGSSYPLNCTAPEHLGMSGGELRVRGAHKDHRFSCVAGNPCTFTVTGFDLSKTDHILIAPLNSTCGNTSTVEAGSFFPSSILRATAGTAALVYRHYHFTHTANPGRFRVCYCVYPSCEEDEHYHLDAGLIFMKGLLNIPPSFGCQIGRPCTISLEGYGLREDDDALRIYPYNLSCGGYQVIVEGDMNATGVLNGSYIKQNGLSDGRNWYKSAAGQYLYFDVYAQRWIMGPTHDPDIPDTYGYAHAYGRWAKTPDSDLGGPWRTWDPYTLTSLSGVTYVGAWTPESPLQVSGGMVPNGTFGEHPTRITDERVRDEALGAPYLLAERFHLGTALKLGAYKICFCPSLDLSDYDDLMCSNNDEYIADVNVLVVMVVRGGERYHCADGDNCIVRTVVTNPMPSTGRYAAIILPAGSVCYNGTANLPWKDRWFIDGELVGTELRFNLGPPPREFVEYSVCVCTDYDNGIDGVPCSEISEYFQKAGTLTLAPLVRLDFEYGSEIATFNLTRGSQLEENDRVRFVTGDDCSISGSLISRLPQQLGGEVWAAYALGTQGAADGFRLDRGLYSACLCTNWDGPDADETPCNNVTEFKVRVGLIFVNVIKNPSKVSSVEASMLLSVSTYVIATAATPLFTPFGRGGRRLSAHNVAGTSTGQVTQRPLGLNRDITFGTVVAKALLESLIHALNTTADQVTVTVNDMVQLSATRSETADKEPIEVIRILVNFTAGLQGNSEQHIWPGPGCAGAVIDPEYPAPPLQCLTLSYALNQRAAMLFDLNKRLQIASLPGVADIMVLELQVVAITGDAQDENYDQVCAAYRACNVNVFSNGALTSIDKLLIGAGRDGTSQNYCGPTLLYPGSMLAVDRAVKTFAVNPVPATGNNTAAASLTYEVGLPMKAGIFNLCYCWATGPDPASTCVYNREFYQTTGVLTVRGPFITERVPCITHAKCIPLIQGIELSAWDRIAAIPLSGTCGSTSPEDAFVIGFEFNPAAALKGPYLEALPNRRDFDFGVVITTGEFTICYCVSLARSKGEVRSCEAASDFSATAGTLQVRGIEMEYAQYSCTKADIGTAPCTLQVSGYGLVPQVDSIYLSPLLDEPCNALPQDLRVDATGESHGIIPNPMRLFNRGQLETWSYADKSVMEDRQYTDMAGFTLKIASQQGTYRVCSCAAPGPGGDGCSSSTGGRNFFNQIGTIRVRGVGDGQLLICEEGLGCSITLSGVHLSMADRVEIIGPADVCGWPSSLKSEAVAINPASPQQVSNDETSATYLLGEIKKDPRDLPVTLRICYCANYDSNGDGKNCTNSTDFTHTGGFINTVICPVAPADDYFSPPVEDVFGDPGDPRFELFMVPMYSCTEAEEEDKNLGLVSRLRLSSKLPLDTTLHTNYSVVIASKEGRCDPGVAGKQARMNMLEVSTLDIMLVDKNYRSISGENLQVGGGYVLQGQAHLVDNQDNTYRCPKWEVQMVPFACSWVAAIWYGVFLHAVFLLSASLLALQNRVFRVIRWLRFLKEVRPQQKQNVGAQQAKLQFQKEAKDNKLHSASRYLEWQLKVKKDLAAGGGELKGEADKKLVAILASRRVAFFGAFVRLFVVVAHVVLMSTDVPDWVYLLVVPATSAMLVLTGQFVLMVVARGCAGCKTGLPLQPLMHSMAAACKVHLDLVLPMLARKHHCEVWRFAAISCVGVILTQVFLPVVLLLLSLLPPRRQVPLGLVPFAIGMVGPRPVARRDMPLPDEAHPRRHSMNFNAPYQLKDAAEDWSDQDPTSPPMTNRSWKSGEKNRGSSKQASIQRNSIEGQQRYLSPDDAKNRRRSASNGSPPRNADGTPRRTSLKERERPSPISITPVSTPRKSTTTKYTSAVKDSCSSRCARMRAGWVYFRKRCYWDFRVLIMSERVSADPEEILQHRLVSTYAFMEASGWYASNTLIRETVEHVCGVSLQQVEARWTMLSVLAGGLDLTALQAFFLLGYLSRLNSIEVIVLAIASVAGIIYGGRPGIVRAFLDFSSEFVRGPWSFMAAMLAVGLIRFLACTPLSGNCPFFPWAFSGWVISVLVVEVPLLLVWLHRGDAIDMRRQTQAFMARVYGQKRSAFSNFWNRYGTSSSPKNAAKPKISTMTSAEEDGKTPVHSPLGRMPGRTFPGFASAVQSRPVSAQEETEKPSPGNALPERLGLVDGQTILREELMRCIDGPPIGQGHRVTLEERMAAVAHAEKALKLIDPELLRNTVWRFQLEELLVIANNEFRRLQLAARAVNLLRTRHFIFGSLENRVHLAAHILPEAPLLRLVHWSTIVMLERLPAVTEHQFLISSEEVWQKLRAKAVVVAVIHRWRGDLQPDPHSITARQLVVFALWYRKRWGKDLELFFWIDYSCLPKEAPKQERSSSKDFVASYPIGPRGEDDEEDMSGELSSRLPHLHHLTKKIEEIELKKDKAKQHATRTARGAITAEGGRNLSFRGVYDDRQVTQESSDAFMPLVYACSDAVLVCEAKDNYERAWIHLELALAYAFAPTGNKMYSIDLKLGLKKRPRKKSAPPTGSPSPITGAIASPFFTDHGEDEVTEFSHPDLGSVFGNHTPDRPGTADSIQSGSQSGSRRAIKDGGTPKARDHSSFFSEGEADDEAENLAIMDQEDPSVPQTPISVNGALVKLPAGDVKFGASKDALVHDEEEEQNSSVMKYAQEAMERLKTKLEVRTLSHPLVWDYGFEADQERIARLLCICLTEPTISAAGGYRRQQMFFGETPSIINLCRLEAVHRQKKKEMRTIVIDRGTMANAAMLSQMGVPEAVSHRTLGWVAPEEDKLEEEGENSSDGNSPSSDTISTMSPALEFPGPKPVRIDRNDRPPSQNSNRVYAHVRKRLDWEEKTMDLYYHHRWQEQDQVHPMGPQANSAQWLVDEAHKMESLSQGRPSTAPSTALGLEDRPGSAISWFDRPSTANTAISMSSFMDRPSTANTRPSSAQTRPSTAQSGFFDRPSTAQSLITDRPSTAKSLYSDDSMNLPASVTDQPPMLEATRARIAFKNSPFKGHRQEEQQKPDTAANNLLRRAAEDKNYHTVQSRAKQPLMVYAPEQKFVEERFHKDFRPTTILLGDDGLTAMQLRASNPSGGLLGNGNSKLVGLSSLTANEACLPSGGMAVTMHQLPARKGIAPEEVEVRGVCFEVIVETTDARWKDGLGIGFTAQDPDRWNRKKPQPRHASGMPRTWVCGYSGRWVLNGRSEMIRPLRGGHVRVWQPGTLQVGDIVTAVAAPPPVDAFRILVNGQVVAERPLSSTGLTDPVSQPLWGVVDVDGACVSVRLRAGTAFGEKPSSPGAGARRSGSEPRTLLGSTMPMGLRNGLGAGPERKRPATSESFRLQGRKRPAVSESPERPATSEFPVRSMRTGTNRALTPSAAQSTMEQRPGAAPVTSMYPGSQRPGTAPATASYV